MGTRNLTMVIHKEETKIAQYGQWDGYPEAVGAGVLKFLQGCDYDEFRKKLDKLNWLTEDQINKINEDKNWIYNYPYLSRDAAEEVLNAVYIGLMNVRENFKEVQKKVTVLGLINKESFASESLFCEWAYVIDLDKMTFEVYDGFNKSPLPKEERFSNLGKYKDSEYYAVKHRKSFSLDKLPTNKEFMDSFIEE